jgi:hypothetical protein
MILWGGGVILYSSIFSGVPLRHARVYAESHVETRQEAQDERDEETPAPHQLFFKWSDDEGHLYLTDDLTKVPERFRSEVETFELPVPEEGTERATKQENQFKERDPPHLSSPRATPKVADSPDGDVQELQVYKEIPFHQFIHITVGMDEAEVISRVGFPSLITPSDYFYGDRGRYRHRVIRLLYLGNRELREKTTVIEIRDGRVVNIERIFPF